MYRFKSIFLGNTGSEHVLSAQVHQEEANGLKPDTFSGDDSTAAAVAAVFSGELRIAKASYPTLRLKHFCAALPAMLPRQGCPRATTGEPRAPRCSITLRVQILGVLADQLT
jgi:hypothetical protein